MTGNKLFDACRMFKHACSFVDCATFCEREPKNIQTGVMSHMVACIVNSAFACEVFIKALLIYYGNTVDEIHGHELYKLWAKYKEIDIGSASNVEQTVKNIFNSYLKVKEKVILLGLTIMPKTIAKIFQKKHR